MKPATRHPNPRRSVAQISNLPYRRLAACWPPTRTSVPGQPAPCRPQVGGTAECNSALRGQQGVALVITLIMLSLVTMMAVLFLGISRREKASVTVVNDQITARLMTEAATARAQAEILARILSTTNAFKYDLLVSTNLINPLGFQRGVASPVNVSYTYANGQPLSNLDDQLRNLANMQYDPRPPVFIQTNNFGAMDFRYFLDLNRNGQFETNGLLPVMGFRPGEFVSTNGGFTADRLSAVRSHFVGDPEWIGVLEHPDRPHSDSNRFVGRFAFLVLPAGKSLDLNHIHNNARNLSATLLADGFIRNTGMGSWELNLAGFLRDLNTNTWRDYFYRPSGFTANTGTTFDDARTLLAYRYADDYKPQNLRYTLDAATASFHPSRLAVLGLAGLDEYGDGPLLLASSTSANLDSGPLADRAVKPWPGSSNPQLYYDSQELFNPALTSRPFTNRLMLAIADTNSQYNRYTLSRMLAQIGTDSVPAESNRLYQADFRLHATNKFHLNFQNDVPDGQTNLITWDPPPGAVAVSPNPTIFFYEVADRMLRSNLRPRVSPNPPIALLSAVGTDPTLFAPTFVEPPISPATHYVMGTTPVRSNFCLTNIQLRYFGPTNQMRFYMTNNEYSATVHRQLQVAANLYDATTTRRLGTTNDYPTVFRPIVGKTATNTFIGGYLEVNNANVLGLAGVGGGLVWATPEEFALDSVRFPPRSDGVLYTNVNLSGVPWVIGAKKGYPNFNEFSLETAVQVSRKLEIRKVGGNAFQTNQMYVLGISNIFGVEAWNSYTQNFQRPLPFELRVTNRYSIALSNVIGNTARRLHGQSGLVANSLPATNLWAGRLSPASFNVPIQTNVLFLTNSAYYRTPLGATLIDQRLTNAFEQTFDPPQLFLVITNSLQYVMIDRSAPQFPRVIDFVNLDNLVTTIDISGLLVADTARTGGRYFSGQQINDGDLWNTNRVDPRGPTAGIEYQIGVALGDPNVAPDVWRSHLEDPVSGMDKQRAIQRFRDFFRPGSTGIVMQVPFTPTRKIYQRSNWQVNDPLVHYTVEDLSDPVMSTTSRSVLMIRPPNSPLPQSNVGFMNERYRPWGGNPNRNPDDTSYRMTLKDPLVRSSDDWEFPTNKFPNVGWLGRVHRGTPWQTVYLKAGAEDPNRWLMWSGSFGTHPTNDWKIVDLFTVAPSSSAARGLLAVNQTNQAAWSAVLSGVAVLSNSLPNPGAIAGVKFDDVFVAPNSPQLRTIVDGINRTKLQRPFGDFQTVGEVLATPELTIASPYLNLSAARQLERGVTDVAVERIPQQVLSLLKTDEPRIVVYAFGQSLKPAERSLVTAGGYYNICTNYQITGEYATKTVLRLENAPRKPRAVVESYTVLPPE